MKSHLVLLLSCVAMLALSGCMAFGGTTRNYWPTLGRQLCDLKAAHDSGAINDQEYCDSKARLLCGGK
jgi:hypothetical protein